MNINELRKIAEAATQGQWQVVGYDSDVSDPYKRVCEFDYGGDIYAKTKVDFPDEVKANQKHIATFSPSLILKLLDELKEAREILSMVAEPYATNGSQRAREFLNKWKENGT